MPGTVATIAVFDALPITGGYPSLSHGPPPPTWVNSYEIVPVESPVMVTTPPTVPDGLEQDASTFQR
jgi:hypothetical protein